ncbi:MAG: UPF0182 family protein [Clostridia bacterium]|nr:UPF0182 family protein [Clostridia bacterium]
MSEQQTNQAIPKKKSKIRAIIVISFLILFAIFTFISFRVDYLEILEIGTNYEHIFWQNIKNEYTIIGINFIIVFLFIYITNKLIKSGLKTFFEEEKKEMPKLPNKSIAFIGGILISIISSNYLIEKIMLALSATSFEIQVPVIGGDIGYYIFQKPCIEAILLYLLAIIIFLTIYTFIYYVIVFNRYFDGVSRETIKSSKFIKHIIRNIKILIIIIGIIVFMRTDNIVLENFLKLNDEERTELIGAGLTDSTIKLWGYRGLSFVMIASIFVAARFFKKDDFKKTIISLIVVPSYLVCLFVVMFGFQTLYVKSNELDKQKSFIQNNIKYTKDAYGLNIDEIDLDNTGTITIDEVKENKEILENITIIDKETTLETLEEYQTNKNHYAYKYTSVGKYNIDGEEKLIYITPREIAYSNRTYDNKTYEYTHGYGVILSSAAMVEDDGTINYVQKEFDGADEKVLITEPRIYYGLETNEIAVTNKAQTEYDYPTTTSENATNSYEGEGGINLNFFDRLIVGIKNNNAKLALSSNVNKESKILLNRNILERAKTLMPYLVYDEEPYMVIRENGSLCWVLDAYTVSNMYPYSQKTLIEVNGEKQEINYIRNSVKVIIDSYDGTTKFYITDRTDPIVMAYSKIYQDLFVDANEQIPEDISKHFKYPEFLYNIQAEMEARYHNVKTDILYRSDDVWEIATKGTGKTLKTTGVEMQPYYTMVKTIDSAESNLGLLIPYTMYGKQNIISYLVGTTENGTNKLKLYKFSTDSNILGPLQLDNQLEQNEEIAEEIEELNVTGSKIIRNVIIVPIKNTLLYVEPIYQVMINEETDIPILKKIVVASGNKIAIGKTLQEALGNLVSQYAVNIEVENTDDIEGLIETIIKANNNLKNSNNTADWEMIGKDIQKLQELIDKLEVMKNEEDEKNKNNTSFLDSIIGATTRPEEDEEINNPNELNNGIIE